MLVAVVGAAAMAGCSTSAKKDGPPDRKLDPANIPDAIPQAEPLSRYGNPDSYVVHGKRYYTRKSNHGFLQRGIASWYGKKFHGRRTSSGEIYDMYRMTAAHRTLPLPTYVDVINLENHRRAVVKVNDRGPFHTDRVIDLSYAAARKLGIVAKGTGLVEIRAIDSGRTTQPVAHTPSRAGSSDMFVQVGAFGDRANAEQLRNRITPWIDKRVHIRGSEEGDFRLYHVQVGPLIDSNAVERVKRALSRLGLNNYYVVLQ